MVELHPHELMETAATPDEPLPPFCTIRLSMSVQKPLSKAGAVSRVPCTVLSEREWSVLIPVANDAAHTPPMPQLALRTPTQVVLELDMIKTLSLDQTISTKAGADTRRGASLRGSVTGTSTRGRHSGNEQEDVNGENGDDSRSNRFDPIVESEREFSPYFYIVELAKFSETFWQRYDQTWWFDKTRTEIINGMYKVVHVGVEPFATIATDAYAGCFRVTLRSLDSYSTWSEPMLLEPLAVDRTDSTSDASGSGLVRKLRSKVQSPSSPAQSERAMRPQDASDAMLETKSRLHQLLTTTYASDSFPYFEELVGFPNNGVVAVMAALEAQTTSARFRAANRELVFLLVVLRQLEKRCWKVRLQNRWVAQWVTKLRLIERVVPELDCYPVEFFSKVTVPLHRLVQDMFAILYKLSSTGWMHQ